MWMALFGFEIRYHLRQPLLYLVTFFLSVLLFIAGTGDGPGAAIGSLHLNAPAVILQHLVKGRYLVLFLMTAFVVSAAVRDFDRHTAELFFSKPISRVDYLTARFAGTMVVCAIPYLVGTIVLAASVFMPWLDQSRIAPFRVAPYAFGFFVLVLPTLLGLGAACYALATWTRSAIATYVGVVAFFAASAAAGVAASQLETRWVGQLLDPFGVTALAGTVRYWTIAELNTTTPDVAGAILWNRLLWIGLGLSALVATLLTFDPTRARVRLGLRWRPARDDRHSETSLREDESIASRGPRTLHRASGGQLVLLQFARRVAHETRTALWSLPFLGAMVLGLLVLVMAADDAGNVFGMPVYPRTSLMLDALRGGYAIVLLLTVVLFAGELIWKERALDLHEVHDAMPTPNGVLLGAKLVALVALIVLYLCIGAAALIGFQVSRGYYQFEPTLYLQGIAVAAAYPTLMVALTCFFHVLLRNRFMGYGATLLFVVGWDMLEELGFEHHLYRYASLPPALYSDFNGFGPFTAPFIWYGLYWSLIAVIIVGLSTLFWKRGTDDAWRTRWNEARLRMRGPVRSMLLASVLAVAVTGSWIFYNTNVLNAYTPAGELAANRAHYEQRYRRYEGLALPRITSVRTEIDIFPMERRVALRGRYRLRNVSTQPLRDVHVSMPEHARLDEVNLPPHNVLLRDDTLGYRIYRLRQPLEPGDSMEFGFRVTMENRGFVNHGTAVSTVENGTYFTNRELFPVIGYDAHRQLADADTRKDQGLAPTPALASQSDLAARRNSPRAPDADRVDFEATVSTSPEQTAVTSGVLQREWVNKGRRYFHYKSDAPITYHMAFASAQYTITRGEWNGVSVDVYHEPRHLANVERMIDAARKTLAYNSTNFSPYQHRHLRIVEFPRYVRDGTSFPGMIVLSESMGFNARLGSATTIDFPFYITAHEVAHQWWGQQLVGANTQGTGTLHETLAQYSALMVSEQEFGRQQMPPILARERERYMRGRANESASEPALAYADRQDYVYYHKGALAMYALRDAVGELSLNSALSRYLARMAFQGPPYATATEMVEEIRAVVPGESQELVTDLFERKIRFNNTLIAATAAERADGTFLVHLELRASKSQADSAAVEHDRPVDDWIDIGIFGESAGNPVTIFEERRRMRGATASYDIVVNRRPTRVTIDPYHKLMDRDSGDNTRRVAYTNNPPNTVVPLTRP